MSLSENWSLGWGPRTPLWSRLQCWPLHSFLESLRTIFNFGCFGSSEKVISPVECWEPTYTSLAFDRFNWAALECTSFAAPSTISYVDHSTSLSTGVLYDITHVLFFAGHPEGSSDWFIPPSFVLWWGQVSLRDSATCYSIHKHEPGFLPSPGKCFRNYHQIWLLVKVLKFQMGICVALALQNFMGNEFFRNWRMQTSYVELF